MNIIETPKRAMLVIPHPDDGESGVGGTVAKWVNEGTHILYVICTNGDKGSSDINMTSEKLAAIRRVEQINAATILGVEEVHFLEYGAGELADNNEFLGLVVEQIRRWQPEIVMAMDPIRHLSHSHRDHRISGQIALDACFPFARDFLHFPSHSQNGLNTHKTSCALLWGTENPTDVVDIGATIDQKIQGLAAHVSQLSSDLQKIEQFAKRRAEDAASKANKDGHNVKYAEVFRRINFRQ